MCQTGGRRTGFDWWSTEQAEESGWHHHRVWRVGLLHALITGTHLLVRRDLLSLASKAEEHTVKTLFLSLSSKTDRVAKGSECFQRSLTLNPFLWSPFQNLCHLGNSQTRTHIRTHIHIHIHVLMRVNGSLSQEKSQIQSRFSDRHLSRTLQWFHPRHLLVLLRTLPTAWTLSSWRRHRTHWYPSWPESHWVDLDRAAKIWKYCLQELNRLNLESSNGKLSSDLSVSYIDSSLISPETGSLLSNTVSVASAASLIAKQNKPKSGRSLLGGPPTLSPLTPR